MKNISVLSITAIIISSMFIVSATLPNNTTAATQNTQNPESLSTNIKDPIYLAKALDGYIVIYQNGDNIPVMKTNIDMRTLRISDQEKIAIGLPIYSEVDLANFLEDFGT